VLRFVLLDPSLFRESRTHPSESISPEVFEVKTDCTMGADAATVETERGDGLGGGGGGMKRSPSLVLLKASARPHKEAKNDTIENTIRLAGYPFEEHFVETHDGCILALYRIPRHGTSKTVLFQHGLMDSAYGWVYSGDERALAFAAYDRGFDVFLSNLRGTPPRKCKLGKAKGYWKYSLNELGMYDVTAIIGEIHCIKAGELQPVDSSPGSNCSKDDDGLCISAQRRPSCEGRSDCAMKGGVDDCSSAGARLKQENVKEKERAGTHMSLSCEYPYKLRVVAHSLGGAALMIYLTTALKLGKPHYINRLVLLSPAGIHNHNPPVAKILFFVDALFGCWFKNLNIGMTVYGGILRVGAQKLAIDISRLVGIESLLNWLIQVLFSNDKSIWGGAMIGPYMSPYIQSMPGFCWGLVRHCHQIVKAGAFVLYDYGSPVANIKHYGTVDPPRVALCYPRITIPVDLVGGKRDGVVSCKNVHQYLKELQESHVKVSYKEFDVGHLEFTFQADEQFARYLFARLDLA